MKRKWLYFFIFILSFTACLDDPEMTEGIVNGKEKPTVTTKSIEYPFTEDGNLLFCGEIESEGKGKIIKCGFYWSTSTNNPLGNDNPPIFSDAKDGVFSCELNNIVGENTYYWRAFAYNEFGYDFGEVRTFEVPKIFEPKASLNTVYPRWRGVVFTIDNKIHITGGEKGGGTLTNENWQYSISSNNWLQVSDFIGEERIFPAVFSIGNYAYVGTGRGIGQFFNDFYRYDGTTDKWVKISVPDNLEARYNATAFSLNEKGFLVGGYSPRFGSLNEVWQYDPVKDSWESKKGFPINLFGGISISNNKRSFVGFSETGDNRRTLWEYNDKNDEWTEFATLPNEAGNIIYSGAIVHDVIYLLDDHHCIWALKISDKTWTRKSDLPIEFLDDYGASGKQYLLTTGNSNSIYVGLGYTRLLYEYRPLWDN